MKNHFKYTFKSISLFTLRKYQKKILNWLTLIRWSETVQTRVAISFEVPIIIVPAESKSTEFMPALLPTSTPRGSIIPLPTSHSLTLRSAPPVATKKSLGLHWTALTSPSWASYRIRKKIKLNLMLKENFFSFGSYKFLLNSVREWITIILNGHIGASWKS